MTPFVFDTTRSLVFRRAAAADLTVLPLSDVRS